MNDNTRRGMIELAVPRLAAHELGDLLALAEKALAENDRFPDDGAILSVLRNPDLSTGYKTLAVLINRTWRSVGQSDDVMERTSLVREMARISERLATAYSEVAQPLAEPSPAEAAVPVQPTVEAAIAKVYETNVGRSPAAAEIDIWKSHFQNGLAFHEFYLAMAGSPEAKTIADQKKVLGDRCDAAFIQLAYEIIYGRGCTANEIDYWLNRIASGVMHRLDILLAMFGDAVKLHESGAANQVHDGLSFQVMGKSDLVTVEDWQKRAPHIAELPPAATEGRYPHRFHVRTRQSVLVTAIASLYRGGDFIEQFMDNITSQNGFDDCCELVIVDADSPENEAETIQRYLARHKSVNYLRMNYRIGIYEAWNVGAKAARGEYLTNTNLDDLRRKDSLELQAGVLDNLPFVDVTYQDFYYTFDPRMSFDEIARMGYKSDLPIVTPYNLLAFNSPHNAPMWRKRLHDELGYFNPQLKSAGDYEFWMRCLAAGKCFYKLNDPHVAYYQNPKGLSTRPDTRGVVEANEIRKTYARQLISESLVMPPETFGRDKVPGVPFKPEAGLKGRYGAVQRALRNAARKKYALCQEQH